MLILQNLLTCLEHRMVLKVGSILLLHWMSKSNFIPERQNQIGAATYKTKALVTEEFK